jgi:hypothetical protein
MHRHVNAVELYEARREIHSWRERQRSRRALRPQPLEVHHRSEGALRGRRTLLDDLKHAWSRPPAPAKRIDDLHAVDEP